MTPIAIGLGVALALAGAPASAPARAGAGGAASSGEGASPPPESGPSESAPAETAPAETTPSDEEGEAPESAPAEAAPGGPSELEKMLAGAGMTAAEPEAPPVPVSATFVGSARLWVGLDPVWNDEREDVVDARVYVTGRVDFSRGDFRARLDARFRWAIRTNAAGDEEHTRYDAEIRLAEAWASYRLGALELTGGLQRIRFGAADLFSPSDFVNPPDLREGFAVSELPSLPVLALKARYHIAGFDLMAILIPVHTTPRIDTIGSDYALLGPASAPEEGPDVGAELEAEIDNSVEPRFNEAVLATEVPDESPQNFQYVARVAGSHGGFDYGVTYGWVFARMPSYRVDARLGPALALARDPNPIASAAGTVVLVALLGAAARGEATLFRSNFHREHHVVADLVTTLGPIGLKVEGGFVPSREITAGDLASGATSVEERPVVDAVAGLDYTREDLLAITLELGYTRVLGDPVEGTLSFFFSDSLRLSALVRLSPYSGDLALQVLGYYDFLRGDYLVAPSVRWRIGDHFAVAGGAAILGGPEDSLGGYYGANDVVWLETELLF